MYDLVVAGSCCNKIQLPFLVSGFDPAFRTGKASTNEKTKQIGGREL